ncbi:g5450 [Coccomyxa viridis]|uniref:tRNA pseudouridine(55) synthase n=1 Tax=Coccomyxa viridis TaxID=1274662 RepID=A0ABP1FZJ1_9CHLO
MSSSAPNAASSAGQHADLAQKRVLEDSAAANGSPGSSAPQQEAKRKKPLPPAPAIVGKGSDFTQEVWQNAALLVDKPKGWTSFDVCAKLRGALKTKKIGHAGTLDPMATGLLIICTGKGTKAIDGFVAMEKAYSGTLRLGQTTPSYDAETDVLESLPWDHITDEDLEVAKRGLIGPIMQQPPMYSAVSIKGERLYKAARRGEEVERPARPVTVHSFDLQRSAASTEDLDFRISCSKGTYIRSLAHDLGQSLRCGAHLTALRRESIGEHDVSNAWSLAELVEAAQTARSAELL